jgi:hypothetical protein
MSHEKAESMSKRRMLAGVGLAAVVLAGAAVYEFFRLDAGWHVTYATQPDASRGLVLPALSMARLRLLRHCPMADFAPHSTPLTFTVASASQPGSDASRAHDILKLLVDRGCDPDARDNGLTPLQDAVLFDDPDTAAVLLHLGADASLRVDTVPPRRSAGLDTAAFAESLCQRHPERRCAQMRAVLAAAR